MIQKQICFVTCEYAPVNPGGIGMLIEQAVSHLSQNENFKVTVIFLNDDIICDGVKTYGAQYYPNVEFVGVRDMLVALCDQNVLPEWAFTFRNYYFSYLVAEYLVKRSVDIPFDIIEFPDYKGFGYVTLKHKRLRGLFPNTHIVCRIHGATSILNPIDNVDIHTRERLHLYQMESYSLEHSDSWTLPGELLAEQYSQALEVQHPSLNLVTPIFNKMGAIGSYWDKERSVAESPKRILFYGKQQHVKGLDLLIDAAIELCEPDCAGEQSYEFIIVGQDTPSQWGAKGSYGAELKKKIPVALNESIQFLGRIDLAELPDLAATCDLAVVPSRMETFCLAVHELNWIGIPLVLNRIPTFEDYFEDEKHCLFFDGSSSDLAKQIQRISGSQEFRESLKVGNHASLISEKAEASNASIYDRLAEQNVSVEYSKKLGHPLVSVIVPYFNDMRFYLRETLESLKVQDYENFEIIVVNDGSTDAIANETFEVIRSEYESSSQFRFYSKPNGGLGHARNFGIDQSQGEYILPLDSDDLIESTMITECVEVLERQQELSAVSVFTSFFPDGAKHTNQIDYVIPYDLDDVLIFLENRAGVATSMFRRSIFDRFRYNEYLPAFEDWDFWMQLAIAGLKVEALPRLLFRYRRRVGSMVSSEGFARKSQLMHYIANRHTEHLQAKGVPFFKAYNQMLAEALEVDENAFPHCKIYLAPGGVFDEKTALYRRYAMEELVEFEVRLPLVKEPTVLRFDPAGHASTIHVNWMSLHHVGNPDAIWVATTDNKWAPLQVAGTARKVIHPDELYIMAEGSDPQIICPELQASNEPYLLRVSMRVYDRFEGILYEKTGLDPCRVTCK